MGTQPTTMAQEGSLIAMIADEDTITGFLLAGIGDIGSASGSNFTVCEQNCDAGIIEEAFKKYTKRTDISVIIINQWIAEIIRHVLADYNEIPPTIVEIPSKDDPYDPNRDTMYMRIMRLMGRGN